MIIRMLVFLGAIRNQCLVAVCNRRADLGSALSVVSALAADLSENFVKRVSSLINISRDLLRHEILSMPP